MNLQDTMTMVTNRLAGKQDPDTVTVKKQWDETATLKGFMVYCDWSGGQRFTFDSTHHYCREIGDFDKLPDYIQGKHQR